MHPRPAIRAGAGTRASAPMAPRRLVEPFALGSPVYADALVRFLSCSADGRLDGRLIDLWDAPEGGARLENPQRLDRQGRLRQPTYHAARHRIAVDTGRTTSSTTTGVFDTFPKPVAGGLESSLPAVLYSDDIGVTGDGVTDDSPAINAAIAEWSAKGGVVLWLRARAGKPLFIARPVVVRSGVTIVWASLLLMGPLGRVVIQGDVVEEEFKARLSADAVQGSTSLPVSAASLGISQLSQKFAAGDRLVIRGLTDALRQTLERQEVTVHSVDDAGGRLVTTAPLNFGFKRQYPFGEYEQEFDEPDLTLVTRQVGARITADVPRGATSCVAGAGIGVLARGDWCLIEDDVVASEVAGSASDRLHREIVQVIGVDGATVSLDRRVGHTFLAARGARLTLLDPAENAHVQDAVVEFAGDAASFPVHTFEFSYAVNSSFSGCVVPNEDLYGSRGSCFRSTLSRDSVFEQCTGRNPRFREAGEGYIFALYHSTGVRIAGGTAEGGRHSVIVVGSSSCRGTGLVMRRSRFEHIDFHGAEEVDNHFGDLDYDGGSALVAFGDDVQRLAGSHHNTVDGAVGRGSSSFVVKITAPSSHNTVRNVTAGEVKTLVWASDAQGYPLLVAEDNLITGLRCTSCTGALIDVQGDRFDAAARGVRRLVLHDIQAEQVVGGAYIKGTTDVEVEGLRFRDASVDGSVRYALEAIKSAGLLVSGCRFVATARGIKLTDCGDPAIFFNAFVRLTEAVVLNDVSGNADPDRFWAANVYVGFEPVRFPA